MGVGEKPTPKGGNMKTKKQIWMVYACDAWGGNTECIMCTTSVTKLGAFIRDKINDGTFDYNDTESCRGYQVMDFVQDWKTESRDWINSRLHYGYYDYCYDGEEI